MAEKRMKMKAEFEYKNYEAILNAEPVILAHVKNKGQEKETLREHTELCLKYFDKLYEEKNISVRANDFWLEFCSASGGLFETSTADKQNILMLIYEMIRSVIAFHDLGKANPQFQRLRLGNRDYPNIENTYFGCRHSMLSAIIYIDSTFFCIEKNINSRLLKRMLKRIALLNAYVISRHHSGMRDRIRDFTDELEKEDFQGIEKLLKSLCENFEFLYLSKIKANRQFGNIIKSKPWMLSAQTENKGDNSLTEEEIAARRNFSISEFFYIRLLYSLLVSCDYYATTEFDTGIEQVAFGNLPDILSYEKAYESGEIVKSIRAYEKEFYGKRDITDIRNMNELRTNMFLDAEREFLEEKSGRKRVFFLEAPTGSGKSNTAFNLSFHAMGSGKKLFYVYPFNTLVEQNRQSLEKLFPDERLKGNIAVVNSITPIAGIKYSEKSEAENSYIRHRTGEKDDEEDKFEDSTEYYTRALLDRQFLNYPIVLTTHVSLFRTLFGKNKEDLFGFLQLSDSVIVLDEIQSYKNSIWAEIMIFLEECAKLMNMKIIIMSATLPDIDILAGKGNHAKRLIKNSRKYFENPVFKDRVKISYELMEEGLKGDELETRLEEHVSSSANEGKKVLVEFIKKKTAKNFFRKLKDKESERSLSHPVFCITGEDSIAERKRILKTVEEWEQGGCILVATQVLEAGADIDMDVGYKDISLLDSEEQFMGRINRSFKKNDAKVYFFDLDEARKIYGRRDYESRIADDLTLRNVRMREILKNKDFKEYYGLVIDRLKTENKDTASGLSHFFNDSVASLNFKDIDERMKLIEDDENRTSIVFCRIIEDPVYGTLDGGEVWEEYKELLSDNKMGYAEKRVRLSDVMSRLNNFIYSVYPGAGKTGLSFDYNDRVGELYCIYDGEAYFEDGKLDWEKHEKMEMFI